jgi:Tfp pilus assembly protein PilX
MMYCPQRRAQNPEPETWNFELGTFSMQSGFLLVTAIFLLVVLAALGAFILTISGTQQTSSALDVQGSRAYQAARAGIEWASYQLLITPPAAVVLVDATSTGLTTSASLSISHTVSGTNRLMLVGVSITRETGGAPSVSSITYNVVQNLSLVGAQATSDGKGRIEIWKLVAPDTGTHNVVVTLSAAPDSATAGVMTFTGVDPSTPLGAFASAMADSGTASVTVASAANELVFDTLVVEGSADKALAPGAGQTERWDLYQAPTGNGGGSTEAGAASVVMSWTFTADKWSVGGVSIKPVAGSAFATACTPGPTTQDVTGMGGTLSGFTAAVTCSSTTYTEGGATVTVYQITSTGAKGTVGTLDRVERQLQATLTK